MRLGVSLQVSTTTSYERRQTPRLARRTRGNTFENGWKPSTVPSMDNEQLEQLAVVIAILAGAAVLGLIVGRLIRGPRQSRVVEGHVTNRKSPVGEPQRGILGSEIVDKGNSRRMAVSRDYLRDAQRGALSSSTRLKCAWESIYFCCCEVAAGRGRGVDGLEHPDANVVEHPMRAISAPSNERLQVEALFRWSSQPQALLPEPCSREDACVLAESLHARTVAFLLSTESGV
jgi:hypothetical protein